MAARKKNNKSGGGRRAAPAAAAPIEAVEAVEKGGMGIDDGIILSTTLLLAFATTLVYLARAAYVG